MSASPDESTRHPHEPSGCPTCGGNDANRPCAYPSEGKPGCLRDARLAHEPLSIPLPDETRAATSRVATTEDAGRPGPSLEPLRALSAAEIAAEIRLRAKAVPLGELLHGEGLRAPSKYNAMMYAARLVEEVAGSPVTKGETP